MKFSELTKKLGYSQAKVYGCRKNICDLQSVRLCTKGQTFFDATILYFASTDVLPAPTQEGVFTILCYGKPIDSSKYDQSSFTLLYIGDDVFYPDVFNTVQKFFANEQAIDSSMRRLVNSLISDNGLQSMVDLASEILGNPIFVVDLQQKYLAISSGVSPNNHFWQEEHKSGYISDEGTAMIERVNLDEKVRKNKEPYLFYNPLFNQKMLIDTVLIQGIEVGHVMLQEFDSPYGENDSLLLRHFSHLIAIELQKNDIFTHNKGVMYSYFLADLLKNPNINMTNLRERLSSLGHTLKEELYILLIPPSSYHISKVRLEVILEQMHYLLHSSIYVIYEGAIVFLISRDKYAGLSEYELGRLEEFLNANRLKAGMSNFFTDLGDAPRFYSQALQAVELGTELEHDNPICYFRDYYIYQMLKSCEKNDPEIKYFIHPGLTQLYEYDKEKSTDFMYTLKEYLDQPGQPSKVSSLLHIHKNTLLYRMDKIKKITGCAFDRGDDFLSFALSFKIMEYLKLI